MCDGYELFTLPLETILTNGEFINSRRYSVQSDSSNRTEKVRELRERFQYFLSSKELKETYHYNIQKLVFLEHFYDIKRKKAINFNDHSSIFQVCNCFLGEVIQSRQEEVILNENFSENPYLAEFKSIIKDNASLFPIFKNKSAFTWFSSKQDQFINEQQEDEDDKNVEQNFFGTTLSVEDEELEMIIFMFTNHLKSLFHYFQKIDSKFVLEWMKQSLSSLPKYILDELKDKHDIRQSFKELLVYDEEELNSTTILDKDFEFLKFLSTNTSDWKLMPKHSNVLDIHVYGSKEHYMSTTKSKMYKFVYTIHKSVEEYAQAYLSYDFSVEKMLSCAYWTYEPLIINNSSKKYSIVKGELVFKPGIPLFAKRRTDGVFSSKSKIIGNKLAEASFLYKTCSLENNQRCLAMGGTIIRKLDEEKCQVIEIKMFNVSGILQTDMVMDNIGLKVYVKQLRELTMRIIAKFDEESVKPNSKNQKLVWKAFCDHCQSHYNINALELISN